MNVQPYFPDPIVVRDNAADQKYDVRLHFIRSVTFIHFVSGLVVAAVACFAPSYLTLQTAALGTLSCLLALSIVRQLFDGGRADNVMSTLLLIPTVFYFGQGIGLLENAAFPVWPIGFALLFAVLYAALCGRDFSFVGQFMLAGIATIASVIGIGVAIHLSAIEVISGLVLSLSFLLYYVYDLAALLTRRRLGEEFSACADLYRDALNFLTYSIRVARHIRQFRI